MNQIENLCIALSRELSGTVCPDCGKCHHVEVSHSKGETPLSPSFPTLFVGVEADDCPMFMSRLRARIADARRDLMKRNGIL